MTTIGDVLAYEYDSPQHLTLDDVAKAAIDSGLVNLFQEWHEENDQSNIDISIRYAGSLQTEVIVSVNGQEVVRSFGWHIQRSAAVMLANLDSKTEEPMFAGVLLALLAEKNREAQLANTQPVQLSPQTIEYVVSFLEALEAEYVSPRETAMHHDAIIALRNAQPVQPTAQEFVDKCYERRGELLRAGFTGGANDLDGIAFVQVMRAMGLQG